MDKEIALILAEVLIKQDEHTAQMKETNSILKDFMGVSIKQWEQQQKFNESFLNELKNIKENQAESMQLQARLKAVEDREANLETRLSNVEKLLKAS